MAKYLTKQNIATFVSVLLFLLQTFGVMPTASSPTPQPVMSAPAPCAELLDAGTP